jgi:hypothetical protein
LNGLKSLFIPDGDFIDSWMAEMDDWCTDHFGALYYPFDLIISFLGRVASTNISTPSLTFPAIQVGEFTLSEPVAFDFTFSDWPAFKDLHDLYLMAVDCVLGFCLVRLFQTKLNSIMGGGS